MVRRVRASWPVCTRAYPAKARPIAASANTTITKTSRHRLDLTLMLVGYDKSRTTALSCESLSLRQITHSPSTVVHQFGCSVLEHSIRSHPLDIRQARLNSREVRADDGDGGLIGRTALLM